MLIKDLYDVLPIGKSLIVIDTNDCEGYDADVLYSNHIHRVNLCEPFSQLVSQMRSCQKRFLYLCITKPEDTAVHMNYVKQELKDFLKTCAWFDVNTDVVKSFVYGKTYSLKCGEKYICTRSVGEVRFKSGDMLSAWLPYVDEEVYITDNGHDYKYTEGIVTFRAGQEYTCVSTNPLTLSGPVWFPLTECSSNMLKTLSIMSDTLSKYNTYESLQMLRVLRDALVDKLPINFTSNENFIQCFTYAINYYMNTEPTSQEERDKFYLAKNLICAVLFPDESDIIRRLDRVSTPGPLTVEWMPGVKPTLCFEDGQSLYNWYKSIISPIN